MLKELTVISPEKFKTVPWKNGLGETIEVAINEGGTIEDFEWRLSMASVIEDGQFSNFNGYTRNLILIDGEGISLQHNDNKIDKLTSLLDIATFDGGNKTVGNLHSGDITDFNIITKTETTKVKVVAEHKLDNYTLEQADHCFIYSLYREIHIENSAKHSQKAPAQHLVTLAPTTNQVTTLTGTHIIIVYITDK